MKYLITSVLCVILLAACKHEPTTPTTTKQPDYFPLQVGNWWEYVSIDGDSTYFSRWEIKRDTVVNGKQYYILNIKDRRLLSEAGDTGDRYLAKDISGNVSWLYKVIGNTDDSLNYFGEIINLQFNRPIGQEWETYKSNDTNSYNVGSEKMRIITYSDTTTVPAGYFFPNCVLCERTFEGDVNYRVFAPNVGMIKRYPAPGSPSANSKSTLTRAFVNNVSYP